MKAGLEVARFSLRAMLRVRAFWGLCAAALLAPVVAWIFGSFFLVDIAKVHRDLLLAIDEGGAIAFLLLLALPQFAADVEGGALPVLAPPMVRRAFWLGRFAGVYAAFLVYLLCAALGAALLTALDLAALEAYYREGTAWWFAPALFGVLAYSCLSLMAAMLWIASFASGRVEASVFGLAFIVLVWALPAALGALRNPEVLAQTPGAVRAMLEFVAALFPPVNAGEVLLAITRGIEGLVSLRAVGLHAAMHVAYALGMLALAVRWFERRAF